MTQPANVYGTQTATDGRRWYIAGHPTTWDAYSGAPKQWILVPRWRLILRWQCWLGRRWATRL